MDIDIEKVNEELNTINEERLAEENDMTEAEYLESLEKMADYMEDKVPAEQGCF